MADTDRKLPTDVPSETRGLPQAGDGASARRFARDVTSPDRRRDDARPARPTPEDTSD